MRSRRQDGRRCSRQVVQRAGSAASEVGGQRPGSLASAARPPSLFELPGCLSTASCSLTLELMQLNIPHLISPYSASPPQRRPTHPPTRPHVDAGVVRVAGQQQLWRAVPARHHVLCHKVVALGAGGHRGEGGGGGGGGRRGRVCRTRCQPSPMACACLQALRCVHRWAACACSTAHPHTHEERGTQTAHAPGAGQPKVADLEVAGGVEQQV